MVVVVEASVAADGSSSFVTAAVSATVVGDQTGSTFPFITVG
jgi:hypothetical protein